MKVFNCLTKLYAFFATSASYLLAKIHTSSTMRITKGTFYWYFSKALIVASFLAFSPCSGAQNIESSNGKFFHALRVDFAGKPRPMTVKDATITSDSLYFRYMLTKKTVSISLSKVNRIRNRVGHNAGKGASFGLGFGIGYCLGDALVIELRRYEDFPPNALERYLLITGASTLLGTLVGLLIKDWETIYWSPYSGGQNGIEIRPSFYSDQNSNGLSIKLHF
ncbi:MAG: hypothetical protein EA409_03565 [Saprospirales bacterium]|nr:MAG: hypothetical protein EA409_03565 [Saprospirales bacterium]